MVWPVVIAAAYAAKKYGETKQNNKNIKAVTDRLETRGAGYLDSGMGMSDEGVAGLRDSAKTYDQALKSGRPLPASVYRSFDLARGGVRDEGARSMASIRAAIAQRRAASGGRMSEEAAAEFARMGDRDVRGKTFETMRDLDIAQGEQELAATQDLYSRLDAARGRILNAGEFRSNLGSILYQTGVMQRLKKGAPVSAAIGAAAEGYLAATGKQT